MWIYEGLHSEVGAKTVVEREGVVVIGFQVAGVFGTEGWHSYLGGPVRATCERGLGA